jgi:drug/metabolite transporter (DMT)-like permease
VATGPPSLLLDPLPLALVLLAALMHAGWNTIAKIGHDGLTTVALMKVPNMLVAALVLAVAGLPAVESWPYLLASTFANACYFYFLVSAYRHGDLSLAYPVARGIAPLLVLALSLFAAREVPSAAGLAGVLTVSVGVLAIGLQRGASRQHWVTVAWAACVGCTISIYTVLDGLGGRLSGNPIGYVAVLNLFTGIIILAVAARTRRAALTAALRTDWHWGLLGGTMMLVGYAIVVYALTLAPMGQIAALRESSVVFATLIGTLYLREPLGTKRFVASCAVVVGILLLVFGG